MGNHGEHQTGQKTFFFFVDDKRHETEQQTLTGLAIKGMIPNFDATYTLMLEGPGNDPDVVITNETTVDLRPQHGPARLYTVPPATFGTGDEQGAGGGARR